VSDDDPQRTEEWSPRFDEDQPGATAKDAMDSAAAREAQAQAQRADAEARGAELRQELRDADARRADEETAKAHEETEAAEQAEEKLSRKERKAKEKAERSQEEARKAREQAANAEKLAREKAGAAKPVPNLSGANVMSPGVGSDTDPAVAAATTSSYEAPKPSGEPSPFERPEVAAGVAFASAFLIARILKRLVD
jgi:membrane protein involved in colicin uptake